MKIIDATDQPLKTVSKEVKEILRNEDSVTITNASHLYGLVSGLKKGEIVINGEASDYVASLNDGANIHIKGRAGNFLADNMTKGTVIVEGDVGYGAALYCYGGTVIIKGNAGDFTASMNKGALIVVTGDVGHDACTYMLAGDVIILGNAGRNLANFLIGGCVYVGGEWASLGHNTKVLGLTNQDIEKLSSIFRRYGIAAGLKSFKKIIPETDKPFYAKKKEVG